MPNGERKEFFSPKRTYTSRFPVPLVTAMHSFPLGFQTVALCSQLPPYSVAWALALASWAISGQTLTLSMPPLCSAGDVAQDMFSRAPGNSAAPLLLALISRTL